MPKPRRVIEAVGDSQFSLSESVRFTDEHERILDSVVKAAIERMEQRQQVAGDGGHPAAWGRPSADRPGGDSR